MLREMRTISGGNSFKEMTGRDKLHFHLACSQDWVRDEGQASAPPPSTPPTKLGRPVWGPYNALRPYRPRGKEAAAAASFPLGEESRPKPSWPDGWGLLRLLKQPWVYIHTNWHFIMGGGQLGLRHWPVSHFHKCVCVTWGCLSLYTDWHSTRGRGWHWHWDTDTNQTRPGHTSKYTWPYCLLSLYYRLCLVLRAYLGHRPLMDTDKKPFLSFSFGKDGHFGIKFVIFGHRQPKLACFEK